MSSSSDRSSTSTPSSESESIASNSTIISDQATGPTTPQTHQSSQPTSRHGAGRSGNGSRNDASNSICSPALTSNNNGTSNGAFTVRLEHHGGNRWSSSVTGNSGLSSRKNHHGNNNNSSSNHQYDSPSRQDLTIDSSVNNKDQNYSTSNQRITRSSQRAAQQVKNENQSDSNHGDDQHQLENEKDLGRKVKRRKGEPAQDTDQDNSQPPVAPQPPAMANICPADYQLPAQNSFQLYKEIRNFSSQQLCKLNHVQPKTPHGFKEYLLNSCLYSLDGKSSDATLFDMNVPDNKKVPYQAPANFKKTLASRTSCSSNTDKTGLRIQQPPDSKQISTRGRHNLPEKLSPPMRLENSSPLYVLYEEHENARQLMRIQHLKERERLILSAEQEILRAYNRAAIADKRQEHPLSACTYLYYQEKYHYSDKSSDRGKKQNNQEHDRDDGKQDSKGEPANEEDSTKHNSKPAKPGPSSADSCKFGVVDVKEKPMPIAQDPKRATTTISASNCDLEKSLASTVGDKSGTKVITNCSKHVKVDSAEQELQSKLDDSSSCDGGLSISENDTNDNTGKLLIDELTLSDVEVSPTKTTSDFVSGQSQTMDLVANSKETTAETRTTTSTTASTKDVGQNQVKPHEVGISDTADNGTSGTNDSDEKNTNNDETISEDRISDEELKILNKEIFVKQLQEIDEKWEKIRNDMLVRHRNEADSLFAVQSMEWEWKTKELGLCDVRLPFKLDSEFVPRIEIVSYDY